MVWPQSRKYIKMDPKGAQTEPKNQQIELQGCYQLRKTCKIANARVVKWSPKCYNGVPGPPKMQEKQKKVSQSVNKALKCAAKCEKTDERT